MVGYERKSGRCEKCERKVRVLIERKCPKCFAREEKRILRLAASVASMKEWLRQLEAKPQPTTAEDWEWKVNCERNLRAEIRKDQALIAEAV